MDERVVSSHSGRSRRFPVITPPLSTSTQSPVPTDTFLTAREAAQIARLHPVTLLRWAREGKVPHRRLSARKIVFPLVQLNAWLERLH